MTVKPGHRKRVKHYDDLGDLYELTFSFDRRMKVRTDDPSRGDLSRSIDAAAASTATRTRAPPC